LTAQHVYRGQLYRRIAVRVPVRALEEMLNAASRQSR
jgi:hypothetical protein